MKPLPVKGKRILITGINGFVGSHLAQRLSQLGALVYGISRSTKGRNMLSSNILNFSLLDSFIKNSKIEICFHLAGESLVEAGQENPYSTFTTNIQGTLNILETTRKNKLERVIIASSVHVYGKNKVPYQEEYIPKPSRPYETSKACVDLIAQSYAVTYSMPVLIPRFVNTYGPGDLHFSRLIPKTIQAVLSGKSPLMWGGKTIRDYLYIEDAIDAYVKLATVDQSLIQTNNIFNFGSSTTISVEELIKKIIDISGKKVDIVKLNKERESEIDSSYVSWNKARKLLNWKPKTPLTDGLRKTILWYENYFKK